MKENKSNLTQYIPALCLLICIALAAGAYFFGFQKFNEQRADVEKEIETLTERYNHLNGMYRNKETYENDIKTYDAKYEELLAEYNADITYEQVIIDLYNNQEAHKSLVENLTLGQVLPVYSFGQNKSLNPENPNPTGINSSFLGLQMEYSVNLNGKYDDIKAFVDELQNTTRMRRVPTSASFTFDDSTGKVMLNMTVKEYAISGEGLVPLEVIVPEKVRGNDNIFDTGIVVVDK